MSPEIGVGFAPLVRVAYRGWARCIPLALASMLVGGCMSWLPWVDGDKSGKGSQKTKPAKLVKFDNEVNVTRQWKAAIGQGLGKKYMRLKPAIAADRIFAADGYGRVEARDRFSGKLVWRNQLDEIKSGFMGNLKVIDRKDPSFLSGGVGVGLGMVLVGTTRGRVIALSAADGAELWRADVGGEVLSPPVTGTEEVLVQTIDGRLLALERESGAVRWSFDNQVPILTLRGTSTPVYEQNVVHAGFANGMLMALRADNGQPTWEQRIMLPEGRSELDRIVDIDGQPLVSGPFVYAAAYQGRVMAVRREDGQPLWEHDISSYLDLAEGYGQVYVVDDVDTVHAIDQQTAEIAWTQSGLSRRRLTSPIAFNNYLAVGDSEGYLHILAQSDGRFVGRRKLGGDGLRSAMIYADGILYVLTNSGALHALEVQVN